MMLLFAADDANSWAIPMKARVTEQGVLIPKEWFNGVRDVEIRRERDAIIVVPALSHDPILELGAKPIVLDDGNASEKHDELLTRP